MHTGVQRLALQLESTNILTNGIALHEFQWVITKTIKLKRKEYKFGRLKRVLSHIYNQETSK